MGVSGHDHSLDRSCARFEGIHRQDRGGADEHRRLCNDDNDEVVLIHAPR